MGRPRLAVPTVELHLRLSAPLAADIRRYIRAKGRKRAFGELSAFFETAAQELLAQCRTAPSVAQSRPRSRAKRTARNERTGG